MTTRYLMPETLRVRRVLPNGVGVVCAINAHITTNFRREAGADVRPPSLWREAKAVVGELAPLDFYSFNTEKR